MEAVEPAPVERLVLLQPPAARLPQFPGLVPAQALLAPSVREQPRAVRLAQRQFAIPSPDSRSLAEPKSPALQPARVPLRRVPAFRLSAGQQASRLQVRVLRRVPRPSPSGEVVLRDIPQ